MAPESILVVEDDEDILEMVTYNLKKEGYDTTAVRNGNDAVAAAKNERPQLVVLDIMLPGMDGLQVCRTLRQNEITRHMPIIMLTAKSEETDKIVGLELGADDYMTKPFSPKELVARIRAVLRRCRVAPEEGKVIRVGEIEINKTTYKVTKRGGPIALSSTEFRLLTNLAGRRGWVFSRDQLLDAVWKGESYVETRTVDVHIRRLREKLEDDPAKPVYIKTKRGIGYYMEGEL